MIGVVDFKGMEDVSDLSEHRLNLRADLDLTNASINRYLSSQFKSVDDFKSVDKAYVNLQAELNSDCSINEPEVSLSADYKNTNDIVKNMSFSLSDRDEESLLRQLNEYAKDQGQDLFNKFGDMAVDASLKMSATVPVPAYEKEDSLDDEFEELSGPTTDKSKLVSDISKSVESISDAIEFE